MHEVAEQSVDCPYCGESIGLLIDLSVPQQNYVEDCQVCCRPIIVDVAVDADGDFEVRATSEDE